MALTALTALTSPTRPAGVTGPSHRRRTGTIRVAQLVLGPWRGTAWWVLAAALGAAAIIGSALKTGAGTAADAALAVLALAAAVTILRAAAVALGAAVRLIPWRPLRAATRVPRWPVFRSAIAVLVAFVVALAWLGPVFQLGLVLLGVPLVLGAAVSAGLVSAAQRRWAGGVGARVVTAAALAPYVLAAAWLASPGTDAYVPPLEPAAGVSGVPTIAASDPSQPGGHAVRSLTYGSGTDRRAHYAAAVDLRTAAVDASPLLAPWTGSKGEQRRQYWGFGPERLPLNARVWMPDAGGATDSPFPLVLLVHGNAHMADPSEEGYAYLGELLASRGVIAASVDQNFLNASWADDLREDTAARAWHLLKHLELWRDWNATPGHRFFGRVDFSRVALVGHSRGGEAVALAAALTSGTGGAQELAARGATVPAFPAPVRGVVAIAPTDGTYQPHGALLELKDVDYLGIEGGHDGNGPSLIANHQYRRVGFSGSGEGGAKGFKATVYAHRANHGQFNTAWGRHDLPRPVSWLVNTRPLLSGEDQRRIARVYVTAFVEASLSGRTEYLPLFRDRRAGEAWLPADRYVTSYEDSRFRLVADLAQPVAVHAGGTAYEVGMPDRVLDEQDYRGSALVLALAATAGAPEVEVELVTRDGAAARLTLSQFGPLRAVPPTQVLKLGWLGGLLGLDLGDQTLAQRFALPLEAFAGSNPAFDPTRIGSVRVHVMGGSGSVLVGRVGLEPGAR